MKKIISILTFVLTCVMNINAQQTSMENYVYLAKVEVNGSPALIDFDGNYVVRPGRYENIDIDNFSEGLCPVSRNGKYGFIDVYGKEVIPCQWERVLKFKRGFAIILKKNNNGYNRRGLINHKGDIIIDPEYIILDFIEGADLIYTEGPVTLLNFKGEILQRDFFSVQPICKDGMLLLSKNGNYGGYFLVDSLGKRKLKNFYDVREFSGGYAVAYIRDEIKGNIPGYIDTEGNQYVVGKYEMLDDFKEGYAIVMKDNLWGVINNKFEEIIPCIYEGLGHITPRNGESFYVNDLIQVRKGEEYSLMTKEGKTIVPYGSYVDFKGEENLPIIKAKLNYEIEKINYLGHPLKFNPYTLLDLNGIRITNRDYDFISKFYQGFACFERNIKRGILSISGEEVIATDYGMNSLVSLTPLHEYIDYGIVRVYNNGKWGLLNKKGEIIVPFYYDNMGDFIDGISVVKVDKKYGAIDTNGKIVVPIDFYVQDFVPKFSGGRLGIRKRTNAGIKAGYIDKEGNEVIPCIYDKVHSFKKISVY